MAKLIDKEPKYEGEKKVWHAFSNNLPADWVVYNTRSVNGCEYDFCVVAPNIGLFIVEVKGWHSDNILTVVNARTIFLVGKEEAEDSPRGQARGYRFDLLTKIKRELGMNPLVMSFVCYPFVSEKQFYEKGLNIVSETNETIFADDLSDSVKLFKKFVGRYNIDKSVKHDELSMKNFVLVRHHFEPTFNLKLEQENLNPGYSRLRILVFGLSDEIAIEIAEEYFKGIKEIVFVPTKANLIKIVEKLVIRFSERKICPVKGNLSIGNGIIEIDGIGNSYSIFNCEIEVVPDLENYIEKEILIEEGVFSTEEKTILEHLSDVSDFNFQQYQIEHATSEKNILVKAGAGTGKTYSMVSRVAYLCNRTADAIADISGEIAMITFTNDAAHNMKNRLKRMFMNYFILTSNEKYMHLIEDMNQIQISTIHKFAISLLQKDCMRMGLGYDSQITNEAYNRKQFYHYHLNDYLDKKNESDPNFVHQLIMSTYQLEDLLISFCDKLYDRSIDIKALSIDDFDEPIASMPYFNELIEQVVFKAERDYAEQLKRNNLISLRECIVQIHKLVATGKLMKQGYRFKYIFVDEFQDTDDVQIETIVGLQKMFGVQCKLFVVGDLKQSIYRFRGAVLSAFDKVTNVKGIGEWEEYCLNRNYRTDRRLLDFFHRVFTNMGNEGLLPYEERKDRLRSTVEKEYDKDSLVEKIEICSKNKESFYKDLFETIRTQRIKVEDLSKIKKLSVEEKTIAILVRYNWQIGDIIKEAEKVGITVRVTEGGDLYKLPSTNDLYRLVMAITHPRNNVYLTNLIRSRYVAMNINLAKISGYTSTKKNEEIIHLLDEYFMLHMGKNWSQIVDDFEFRPVLVVLRDIYEATKPWKNYKDEDLKTEYRENYECLIEKITRHYSREYLTINKVCEFLKINITTYQQEASRTKVTEYNEVQVICTTVHKSKGLEYGTVILPCTNEDISNINVRGLNVNIINGKVTYSFSIDKKGSELSGEFDEKAEIQEKMKEESRILYVALTRAIRNVVWLYDLDTDIINSWGNYLEVGDLCQ